MCKRGDIILIDQYRSQGSKVTRHSFVVIEDQGGNIQGVPFDFISLVMSSFKDEEQKAKKMKFPGNFPIVADDVDIESGNEKAGFVKAEQFYFFKKSEIQYTVIGEMKQEIFDLLIDFIVELQEKGVAFEMITDNLKE